MINAGRINKHWLEAARLNEAPADDWTVENWIGHVGNFKSVRLADDGRVLVVARVAKPLAKERALTQGEIDVFCDRIDAGI